MAYAPAYDGFARSISRRPSLPYSAAFSQHGGVGVPYSDPGVYGGGGDHVRYGQSYGAHAGALVPMGHHRMSPEYDDMDMRDHYDYDMGGGYNSRPMTPMTPSRSRRHSVSFMAPQQPAMDGYRLGTGNRVKFKRKGSLMGGIGLDEAQAHVRLSSNDAYSYHDLHADRRRILLRVKWAGYHSMTYEIPLDGYDRRVSLETLARRVSRACVHYLQANVIPILWDRVVLHHLEEVSYGVWQPMLSTR
ncbi:hypothetical protein FA15DRAFT_610292 [Coprinopsis marcescibilis]|uniref:DUF6741 domain-containing protein n=1 Tax=Coprinopsis marcescibilis TaxID=230819 RepID=A0A5C3L891_COPMA|nr:hypothetical protein FA15DRAFT_610292 [Coprinopsis marcescibilis]